MKIPGQDNILWCVVRERGSRSKIVRLFVNIHVNALYFDKSHLINLILQIVRASLLAMAVQFQPTFNVQQKFEKLTFNYEVSFPFDFPF